MPLLETQCEIKKIEFFHLVFRTPPPPPPEPGALALVWVRMQRLWSGSGLQCCGYDAGAEGSIGAERERTVLARRRLHPSTQSIAFRGRTAKPIPFRTHQPHRFAPFWPPRTIRKLYGFRWAWLRGGLAGAVIVDGAGYEVRQIWLRDGAAVMIRMGWDR